MEFPPCCRAGRVENPCAETVYQQRVEGLFRLDRNWTGWKIKDGALLGPRGMRFTPATLAIAWSHLQAPPAAAVGASDRDTEPAARSP
jgi:hypothetical protein